MINFNISGDTNTYSLKFMTNLPGLITPDNLFGITGTDPRNPLDLTSCFYWDNLTDVVSAPLGAVITGTIDDSPSVPGNVVEDLKLISGTLTNWTEGNGAVMSSLIIPTAAKGVTKSVISPDSIELDLSSRLENALFSINSTSSATSDTLVEFNLTFSFQLPGDNENTPYHGTIDPLLKISTGG